MFFVRKMLKGVSAVLHKKWYNTCLNYCTPVSSRIQAKNNLNLNGPVVQVRKNDNVYIKVLLLFF